MATQVEINSAVAEAVLNSVPVAMKCMGEANRVANRAGPHYMAKGPYHPGSRALALVVCADGTGAYLEATEKTLSKAVSACRS